MKESIKAQLIGKTLRGARDGGPVGPYWAGQSEESYECGPFSTIEDAAEEYFNANPEDDFCCVGESVATPVLIDGGDVINRAQEEINDLYEDALDDWCDKISIMARDDLSERLTKVFHDWLAENSEKVSWDVIHEVCTLERPVT